MAVLLPPGLPIGTVMADGAGGWRVALLADAASSQDVEVLNFSKPPEAAARHAPSCRPKPPA